METILFLSHTEADGSLPKAALEVLTAAKTLSGALAGSTLAIGLFGGEVPAQKLAGWAFGQSCHRAQSSDAALRGILKLRAPALPVRQSNGNNLSTNYR